MMLPGGYTMNTIALSLESLDALTADAIAIGLTQNHCPFNSLLSYLDWRLCGEIARLSQFEAIPRNWGERVLITTKGRIKPSKLFLFGLNAETNPQLPPERRIDWMIATLQKAQVASCVFALPPEDAFKPIIAMLHSAQLPFENQGVFGF